jgi:hypothetical protein
MAAFLAPVLVSPLARATVPRATRIDEHDQRPADLLARPLVEPISG